MSDKNELKLAVLIAVVCIAAGAVSYGAYPVKAPDLPVRVMLEATGKNVLFDHKVHQDEYGLECVECHHSITGKKGKNEQACGACHKSDGVFKPALGKKGLFDHEEHIEDFGLSCQDCHHMYDEQSDGKPQACSECHMDTGDKDMPGIEDACHKKCISCHKEMEAGPTTSDCNACHKPRMRKDAFHNQCTACHEDTGAGPGMADCKKCHGY
ncbi:MAG: hypothetical protein GXP53_00590 [Deltaproteobacteria bacterium]|nr:hypothetical protein [Deltaproteobacteria bacterium]